MIPVWVWILLWIFLFVNLGFGVYYAVSHGLHALNKAGKTGSEISDILSRMNEEDAERILEDSTPFFARPLSDVSDRYTQTRIRVEERHIQRSLRHDAALQRWDEYHQEDLEKLGDKLDSAAAESDARAEIKNA
ncbi:hypothetical protein [Alloscardovia criceti]|uniref:hypothetical protein n=1 Tax=Alloscardovia criceti TaxID=356828 RepID=UPI000360059A|nr:hypothetical protein [Alloscardovia criceti]